jgi:hypothetical protein
MATNGSFDWASVKVVEVDVLPSHSKAAKNRVEPFAILSLAAAALAVKATESAAQMFVWIWIVHQTKRRGSEWVALSKGSLVKYGISKKTKKAALARLEVAGLITVKRQPGRATVVKLVKRKH